MDLHLTNFRCWRDLKVTLTPGLTLIKGSSGLGKSTIFQAIYWCLYGSLRKVHPLGGESMRTIVTITTSKMRIMRQRGPGLLQVDVDNNTYQGESAQSIIDEHYGTSPMWLASSYSEQKERNLFLTSSNAERLDLLTKIAFSSDDPSTYISRIDNEVNMVRMQYDHLSQPYTHLHEEYVRLHSTIDITYLLNEEQERDMRHKLESLQLELSRLLTQRETRNKLLYFLRDTEEKLRTASHQLEIMQEPQLLVTKDELRALERVQPLLVEREACSGIIPNSTAELLEQCLMQEQKIREESMVVRNFGLSYNKEAIAKAISTIKTTLELQPTRRLQQDKSKIINLMYSLHVTEPPQPREPDHVDVNALESIITTKMELLDVARKIKIKLACPSCSSSLYLDGTTLKTWREIDASHTTTTLEREIDHLRRTIRDFQAAKQRHNREVGEYNQQLITIKKNKEKREQLEETLSKINAAIGSNVVDNSPPLSDYEETLLNTKLSSLERLTFPAPPPYSSSDVRTSMRHNTLLHCISQHLSCIKEQRRPNTSAEARNLISVGGRLIKQREEYLTMKSNLECEIAILTKLLNEQRSKMLDDPTSRIEEIQDETTQITNLLQLSRNANHLKSMYEQLVECNNKLVKVQERLTNLIKLKEIASNVECHVHQSTVDFLNNAVNTLCGKLFSSEIKVVVSLYRTIKSTSITKPSVNFQITYQGGLFDSIRQLSGGEGDRISLAFHIALNKLTGSTILLLDEALGSIGADMKDNAIQLLHDYCPNTIVLCVDHNTVEGRYDRIVDLDTYT